MNVTEKPRLHLIGAKGQLGSHLIKVAKANFQIVAYSSKPSLMSEDYTIPFHYPMQDAVSYVCENEPIIFLSHSNAREDIEQLKQLLKKLEEKKPHPRQKIFDNRQDVGHKIRDCSEKANQKSCLGIEY